MGITAYIIPQESILQCIIGFMVLLAAYVVYQGLRLRKLGKANLDMIGKLTDVTSLEQAVLHDNNHEQAFTDFEQEKGRTNATGILFDHIKAIYDAGFKSSRLDADLLVQNTVDKLFEGVDSLKTTISIFLVVGILGTLFGLALSIGSFSGENFLLNNGQATGTANALSNLFMNLRGAFAPSMWGVAFTIAFVLLYSWGIQEGCVNKFKEKLTITTIRNWLPKLYPTDFQRGDKSIVKLNAVISNAEGINRGVTDLEKNLNSSNETLRSLAQVSKAIDSATDRFDNSTSKILKLQRLYEEIERTNKNMDAEMKRLINSVVSDRQEAYQEYLELAKDQNANLQDNFSKLQVSLQQKTDQATSDFSARITSLAKGMGTYFSQLSMAMKDQKDSFGQAVAAQNQAWQKLLEHQEKQLAAVIQQLQSYDANFFQTVNESRAQLDALVKANEKSVGLTQKATADLNVVSDKLSNQQEEIVNAIKEPIVTQLQEIALALKGINKPLNDVMQKFQTMLEHNARSLTALVQPIRDTAEKLQNDKNNLGEQQQQIATLLSGLQSTLDSLNDNMDFLVRTSAESKGVSEDTIKELIRTQKNRAVSNVTQVKQEKEESFFKKHLVTIIIAALLFISMIIQGVMVANISSMQQTQNEVNQILLKGDMNNSSSGSNP